MEKNKFSLVFVQKFVKHLWVVSISLHTMKKEYKQFILGQASVDVAYGTTLRIGKASSKHYVHRSCKARYMQKANYVVTTIFDGECKDQQCVG
jgi:hypothetical protein